MLLITLPVEPLDERALPYLPAVVQVGPSTVPVRLLLEALARTEPVPSLKLYATERFVLSVEVKVAVTDFASVTLSEQVPIPVQLPLHPAKVDPESGVAVKTTTIPLA